MKNLKYFLIILILIFGVLASRTLFKHNFYFNMHDDLQMMRQLQLEKCFQDKQIPCRWVPDMGYKFGLPLFNYYPQLPYLVGEVFRLFNIPFNDVAKLTFALGIIASGFAMFLMSKEYFGSVGGALSAIFYMWAPYRAVDVYVRGAMNESWAWVWFPLILWSSYKLVRSLKSKYVVILSLSFAALLLTHNVMVMIFAPVFLAWLIFWIFKEKSLRPLWPLTIAGFISLGLAAFFTLPAIFEQKLVHIDTLITDYFQYSGHFTSFNQLFFSRFWGDGPSVFGTNDGMAFPVGHIHWILILIIGILLVIKIWKKRKLDVSDWVIIFGILAGTFAAFMSHERSTFIWLMFPTLKFVQFPWRFLTLNVFGYALAIGSLSYLLEQFIFFKKKNVQAVIFLAAAGAVVFLNWNFFTPVHGGPLTDEQKFSGEAWRLQTQAGIRDYLPVSAKDDPFKSRDFVAEVTTGKGEITDISSGTNWIRFNANLKGENNVVRINVFNYPNWTVFIDGNKTVSYTDSNEEWGRIYFQIPSGEHAVYAKLLNTPLRTFANAVSLITWVGLFIYLLRKKFFR